MTDRSAIQEKLERGLYYYGLGEVGKAIQLWREVLELDPGNELAREYLEIETGRPTSQPAPAEEKEIFELDSELPEEAESVSEAYKAGAGEFFSGQQFLLGERWLEAEQAFLTAHRLAPANPFYWAHVELARARVVKEVIEKAGGLHRVPRLTKDLKDLAAYDFTQEEGFILSLINGEISFEDLIAISPVPRFITYRILHRLISDGLIALGEV